jgi:hypothetical protein
MLMEHSEFVEEALRHVLPDECEFVGDAAVREIAAGPVEIVRAEHGSNLDLTEILVMLAATASLVQSTITICQSLAQAQARRVSVQEVMEAAQSAATDPSALDIPPDVRDSAVRYVVGRYYEGEAESRVRGTSSRYSEG